MHKACPIKIPTLLTDNGKEFTDRLLASKEHEPGGEHEFDQRCQALGMEHRLTKPRTPNTNGMVERFNGRIADVLKTHRFNNAEDMGQTLMRYVALYNHQLPQSALKSKTPMQAMKDWYASHPQLFHRRRGFRRQDSQQTCTASLQGKHGLRRAKPLRPGDATGRGQSPLPPRIHRPTPSL